MNYQNKTKPELISELENLNLELNILKEKLSGSNNLQSKSKEQISQFEGAYDTVFESTLIAILLIDPVSGEIKHANPAACKFYGWTYTEICSKKMSEICLNSPEEVNEEMQKAVSGKRNHFHFKHKLASGEVRDIEVFSNPIEHNNSIMLNSMIYDITGRKNAEASIQKWKSIISASPDGIGMVSLEGKIQLVSDTLAKMFGYTAEEKDFFIGHSVYEFIDKSEHEKLTKNIQQLLSKKKLDDSSTYLSVKKDQSRFYAEINSSILYDNNGNPESILYVQRDITERKKLETENKEKTNVLSNLIVNLKEGVLLENSDRKIVLTNQLFCEMFSIPVAPEAMEGADCTNYAEQSKHLFKDPDGFVAKLNIILAEKKSVFNDELVLVDGRYLERDYIPTYLDHKYSGHLWKYRDITIRMNAIHELKKIQQAVEQSPVMITITNMEGVIEYVNPKLIELTGYSQEELLGKNPKMLKSEAVTTETYSEIAKILLSGNKWTGEFQHKRKNGELYWVSSIISPILDEKNNSTHILAIDKDITEKKNAKAAIAQLNESLELKVQERTKELYDAKKLLETELKEHLKTEHALNWNQSLLELMSNSSPLGFLVVDNRTDDILYFNKKFVSIWNIEHLEEKMTRGELKNNDIIPDCLPMLANIPAFAESCRPLQDENNRVVLGDEIEFINNRTIRRYTTQIRGEFDQYFGRFYIFEDITQLKQNLIELRESREKHKSLSEASFDSIFFSDKGICVEQNQAAREIFGYSDEDAIGRPGTDWIVPEDQDMVMKNMIAGYEKPYDVTALRKDGTTFPCTLRGKMYPHKGKMVRVTSLRDITEQRLAEEALKKSERLFSLFMDQLPALVFMKSAESRMIYSNKAMHKALGSEGWNGKSLFEIFDPETSRRIIEDDKNTIQAGKVRIEESFFNLDGELHHYETQKFVLEDIGEESFIGGIALDITTRKKAEDEAIKARRDAEQANIAKSEFLSRMSHELRTPLNSILGFAQLMQMGELTKNQEKNVNFIYNGGKHLLQLINEVLDISSIEAGRISFSIEPTKFNLVLQEIIEVLDPQIKEKEIKFNLLDSPSNYELVMTDHLRLKQILLNLLDNSIKYGNEGGEIVVSTETRLNKNMSTNLRISIRDSGIGISPANLTKIFNPFERIGAERTLTEGTGLGLAVVQKLLIAMGGSIEVESVLNEGSTFIFELPIAIQDGQSDGNDNNSNSSSTNSVVDNFGSILYVEDNVSNIELVKDIISAKLKGIKLMVDSTGGSALKLAIENQPDLILLDLDLPEIHGSKILAKLKQEEKTLNIPVVIVSANALPEMRENMIALGASDYLSKPFDIFDFLNLVDKYVTKKNSK